MLTLFTDTDTDITPVEAAEYGYKLIRRPYAENPAETSSLYIGSSSKKNYRIHGTIKAYVPISFVYRILSAFNFGL